MKHSKLATALVFASVIAMPLGTAAQREYVIADHTAGVLTRPDSVAQPRVAILYDNGFVGAMHPMCTEMAKRGFVTWCAISDPELATSGDWTNTALEMKAAINYLRGELHIATIVLYGHSGGGAAASFYEAVAENGVSFCQDRRKTLACADTLGGLPRADAAVFPDAHPGMDVMNLRGLNPSLHVEGTRVELDPTLDPFSTQNGFNADGPSHYSPAFQKRYFAAQASEMKRLVDRAVIIETGVKNGTISNPAAEVVAIPGFGIATHLDELDPSISVTMSTVRPERLLRNDGTIVVQPISSVWNGRSPFVHSAQDIVESATTFLAMRAVRARDSMSDIDWCSANSDTTCNTRHIRVPVLFIAAGASDFIADEERMYTWSPASDKEFIVVQGALHAGEPCTQCETVPGQYANSMKNQYDYIARWVTKRFSNAQQ